MLPGNAHLGQTSPSPAVTLQRMDPLDLARQINAENLWLRDLLTAVAQDLERMAAVDERQGALLARAQRIRKRLFEGPG